MNDLIKIDPVELTFRDITENKIEDFVAKKGQFDVSKVTRVEVVDQNGRSYVNSDVSNIVELSQQDDGKTLKVFIYKK